MLPRHIAEATAAADGGANESATATAAAPPAAAPTISAAAAAPKLALSPDAFLRSIAQNDSKTTAAAPAGSSGTNGPATGKIGATTPAATATATAAASGSAVPKATASSTFKVAYGSAKPKPYLPPVLAVPHDSEGFVQSFAVTETAEMNAFFEKYGFVVVRDVLSAAEVAATVDDIWTLLETRQIGRLGKAFRRDNPRGWDAPPSEWQSTGLVDEGILSIAPIWSKQALANRQHPNVYAVCRALLGRDDLLVNHDRYGFFRPTKGVLIDGVKHDFPHLKTWRNLHLDMNPWQFVEAKTPEHSQKVLNALRYNRTDNFITENNEVGCMAQYERNIQLLLNLVDNRATDGGFHVVPGFAQHFVEWTNDRASTLRQRYGTRSTFIVLPETDPLQQMAVRVTARAGSLVVWDQRTAHGSQPNDSDRFRMAQFFKVFHSGGVTPERGAARAARIKELVGKALGYDYSSITPLGRKLFGWDAWPSATANTGATGAAAAAAPGLVLTPEDFLRELDAKQQTTAKPTTTTTTATTVAAPTATSAFAMDSFGFGAAAFGGAATAAAAGSDPASASGGAESASAAASASGPNSKGANVHFV